jgi:cytoskeletal protein CcmA (bactofilin family)
MLRSDSFFGKRENNNNTATSNSGPLASTVSATSATSSLSSARPTAPSLTNVSTSAAAPTPAPAPVETTTQTESPAKLTVGPNIKLKGVEITDCDTLVVEGFVEATMDSRLMQIAKGGSFKGAAEIDIAEIHGEFDGTLTVRQKLVIHESGKVSGKISYGKLVIEEGGQLSGEIQVGTSAAQKGLSVAKTA